MSRNTAARNAATRDTATRNPATRDTSARNTSRRARSEARAESFRCLNCGLDVSMAAAGTTHRNHCPNCLWSRHLDDTPGDRAADCGARMEPLAISVRGDGEWILVHRCAGCGVLHANRTAGDDNVLPLTRLAVGPLARPPFPLERLGLI
ncbi:RNHCP domain-containing protein [Streptomyces sp. 21So2-11]|uniref:RNHCP domain-containing protein n=1 Tax=Streptomyces sp. 21So2-11 TaxID=3144408 RepID=UPI00321B0067